jgi:hypothetical protein
MSLLPRPRAKLSCGELDVELWQALKLHEFWKIGTTSFLNDTPVFAVAYSRQPGLPEPVLVVVELVVVSLPELPQAPMGASAMAAIQKVFTGISSNRSLQAPGPTGNLRRFRGTSMALVAVGPPGFLAADRRVT